MAKKRDQLPVSVDELERQLASVAAESAKALAAAEPVYSSANIIRATNARQFKHNDQVVPRPLRCVVLAASHVQAYYDTEYDPDSKTPPVCFALAQTEIELAPHETSPIKQHVGPCATCPQNQPGTGLKGGWTRACSGRRRLALLSLDDKQDDPTIFTTEISAGGLREYANYVKALAAVQGLPTYLAGTSIDFHEVTEKDTWYLKCEYLDRLTRFRPEWVTPQDGVLKKGGDGKLTWFDKKTDKVMEDWMSRTLIGRKVKQVLETKVLLAPPSLTKPAEGAKKGKRPVTGAKRVSVKEARAARKGKQ